MNQVAAPDYTLADTVIQLVMSQGRRHDVGVLLASHYQQTGVVSHLYYPTNLFSPTVGFLHVIGRISLARENEAGGSWGQAYSPC